jgi:hypothetical protein
MSQKEKSVEPSRSSAVVSALARDRSLGGCAELIRRIQEYQTVRWLVHCTIKFRVRPQSS